MPIHDNMEKPRSVIVVGKYRALSAFHKPED